MYGCINILVCKEIEHKLLEVFICFTFFYCTLSLMSLSVFEDTTRAKEATMQYRFPSKNVKLHEIFYFLHMLQ